MEETAESLKKELAFYQKKFAMGDINSLINENSDLPIPTATSVGAKK